MKGQGQDERSFMQKYYHKGAFFQSVTDGKVSSAWTNETFPEIFVCGLETVERRERRHESEARAFS